VCAEIGELLLHRVIAQFKRAYKRNDKPITIAAAKFLAHLINQGVLHEVRAAGQPACTPCGWFSLQAAVAGQVVHVCWGGGHHDNKNSTAQQQPTVPVFERTLCGTLGQH
jgi:hypothetical protein